MGIVAVSWAGNKPSEVMSFTWVPLLTRCSLRRFETNPTWEVSPYGPRYPSHVFVIFLE